MNHLMQKTILLAASMALMMFVFTSTANESRATRKTVVLFSKANNGKINVQIKGNTHRNVALYLFDPGGRLVQKTESNTRNIITLQRLERGQYLYQCFKNDVQLKSGNLYINKNSINYD